MNNNNQHHSGFMAGFVIGVVVGAVIIFLIATKKGKKILKLLSEEGLEGVAELEELLVEDFVEPQSKPIKNKVVRVAKPTADESGPVESSSTSAAPLVPHALGRIQTTGRRFFKGIPKRG